LLSIIGNDAQEAITSFLSEISDLKDVAFVDRIFRDTTAAISKLKDQQVTATLDPVTGFSNTLILPLFVSQRLVFRINVKHAELLVSRDDFKHADQVDFLI